MLVRRRFLLGALAVGALAGCRASAAETRSPSAERLRFAISQPAPTFSPTPVPTATPRAASRPSAADGRALERALDLVIRQQRGSFGVAVRELGGPVTADVGARDRFRLASLYKVLLMHEVMRGVEARRWRLEDSITTAPDYSFGEPAGGVPPDTTLSIGDALAAAIEISSNGAALALISLVGPDALRAVPGRLGLADTSVDAVATGETGHYDVDAVGSARDLVELFARLGRQQLVSPALDRRMIDYLLAQKINDRLPLLLPPGTPVAHKTGELDYLTHDGGLVLRPSRPYAIVALAEGESPTEGREIVAELSRVAYAFFAGGG